MQSSNNEQNINFDQMYTPDYNFSEESLFNIEGNDGLENSYQYDEYHDQLSENLLELNNLNGGTSPNGFEIIKQFDFSGNFLEFNNSNETSLFLTSDNLSPQLSPQPEPSYDKLPSLKRRINATDIDELNQIIRFQKKEISELRATVQQSRAREQESIERERENKITWATTTPTKDPRAKDARSSWMAKCAAIELAILVYQRNQPNDAFYQLILQDGVILDTAHNNRTIYDPKETDELLVMGLEGTSFVNFIPMATNRRVGTKYCLNLAHYPNDIFRTTLFRLPGLATFALFFEKNANYTVLKSVGKAQIPSNEMYQQMYVATFQEIERAPEPGIESYTTKFQGVFRDVFGLTPQEYIWNYVMPGSIHFIFTTDLPQEKADDFRKKISEILNILKFHPIQCCERWNLSELHILYPDQINQNETNEVEEAEVSNDAKEEDPTKDDPNDSSISVIIGSGHGTPTKVEHCHDSPDKPLGKISQ
eukprot:TRINITY_DN10364_c0_g1_i1.p1 TRINITY_DN10364_c0_g1~~TRINITY_DN10364_c0_g1_i1.p1  ORF type:complete len:480 (-),score=107.15 TRINITY_DN10364_c0_g1_i1:29-1468(-)